VQILHPFTGSAQQYAEEIFTPDRLRPDQCPQCQARQPLIAHGFYSRTPVEAGFDGSIRVRRYLCRSCKRTVSLLPQFAFVISLFPVARLLDGPRSGGALPMNGLNLGVGVQAPRRQFGAIPQARRHRRSPKPERE
jgi:hypothetical protein